MSCNKASVCRCTQPKIACASSSYLLVCCICRGLFKCLLIRSNLAFVTGWKSLGYWLGWILGLANQESSKRRQQPRYTWEVPNDYCSFNSFSITSPTTIWIGNILHKIYTVRSTALFGIFFSSGRGSGPHMEVILLAIIIPSRSGAPCLATGLAGPCCSLLSAKLLNHLINISKSKTSACCYVTLLFAFW